MRNHVRERKRQMGLDRRETFVPQSYRWAQEAQVDWYEAWVDLGDERTRVQVFTMRSMGTGGNADSATASAALLRNSLTVLPGSGDSAHTSTIDARAVLLVPCGEFKNRDSAATNAAASSWCANSITWSSRSREMLGIRQPRKVSIGSSYQTSTSYPSGSVKKM